MSLARIAKGVVARRAAFAEAIAAAEAANETKPKKTSKKTPKKKVDDSCTPKSYEMCPEISRFRGELNTEKILVKQLREELAHVRAVNRLVLDDWEAVVNGRKNGTKRELRAILGVYREMV